MSSWGECSDTASKQVAVSLSWDAALDHGSDGAGYKTKNFGTLTELLHWLSIAPVTGFNTSKGDPE
jgi:hypothetical protein